MSHKGAAKSKTCAYCQKVLHGRSDQRFCNDTCRNTYNRYKRAYEKVYPPDGAAEIIKVIKKNYEVLKQKIPGQFEDKFGVVHCDTNVIVQAGLNLKFYTSSFDSENERWFCIFDRCYCIQGDNFKIISMPEQLGID